MAESIAGHSDAEQEAVAEARIADNELHSTMRLEDRRHRRRTINTILKEWRDQQKQDRSLRESYAKKLIRLLVVQIFLVNLFFLLIGCKILEYPPWTVNSFIMAVFAEVAAMVLLIVRYLFTSSTDKILDLIVPVRRKPRRRPREK